MLAVVYYVGCVCLAWQRPAVSAAAWTTWEQQRCVRVTVADRLARLSLSEYRAVRDFAPD